MIIYTYLLHIYDEIFHKNAAPIIKKNAQIYKKASAEQNKNLFLILICRAASYINVSSTNKKADLENGLFWEKDIILRLKAFL